MLAYNELTGEVGAYPVTALFQHLDPVIVELTIDGETITTTPEHPFYTDDAVWVDAAALTVGESIRTLDGSYGTVTAVEIVASQQWMYNLTVDAVHTFAVGDGEWVVHNACRESEYGETRYGQTAQRLRLEMGNPDPSGTNVAVFQFKGDVPPEIQTLIDAYPDYYRARVYGDLLAVYNITGLTHSEILADQIITLAGVSRTEVTAIYTEYSPCGACTGFISQNYRHIFQSNQLYFTFNYRGNGNPTDIAQRDAAVAELFRRGVIGPIPYK